MGVAYLFQVGDKIFYPMHGAGVIKAFEDREIQGKVQKYCILEIPLNNMDIMIPMKKLESSGVRKLLDKATMKEIMDEFRQSESNEILPWKERYKTNMEKIKSGDMQDTADVVRDLMNQSKEKVLNSSEKQMLNHAKDFLVSELTLGAGLSKNQANELLQISS